jgi:hypothetical protein
MNRVTVVERVTDTVWPLVLIAVLFTLAGKGFPSLWPVAACLAYSVIQPFVRFFLFDKVRGPLMRAGKVHLVIGGSLLLYTTLAILLTRVFLD